MRTKEEMFQELVAAFPTLEFDQPIPVSKEEPDKFYTIGRAKDGSDGGLYFTYSGADRPWYEIDLDYMGVLSASSAEFLHHALVVEMQMHIADATTTLRWLGRKA